MATEAQILEGIKRAQEMGNEQYVRILTSALQRTKTKGSIADPAAQGLTLGFSDELAGALGAIPASIQTGNSILDSYRGIRDAAREREASYREANPALSMAAELGGGLLTGGAGTGRALAGTAGKQMLARSTALGAGLGGASGLGHSTDNPLMDMLLGAAAGSAAGFAFPAIGQKLSSAAARSMATKSTDPYRKAADVLEKAGVKLTTGQKTGAKWAKAAERTLTEVPIGGKPVQTLFENQHKQYQSALFRMLGVDADMLTEDALEKTAKHLSSQYVRALSGKVVSISDDEFLNALGAIEAKHARFVDDPTKGAVRRIVGDFLDEITERGGAKSGEWYQGQRSVFAQKAKTSSPTAELYADLKNALDDAFSRAAGPATKAGLDAKWAQYRQLRELYDRLAGGSAGAEGFIPPTQLARMASKGPGSKEWKELTRAAATVLPDRLGNSGTAQRNYMLALLAGTIDPFSTATLLGTSRALSGQLASGRSLDVSKLLPNGSLLMNRGAGTAALAGLPLRE